LSGTKSKYAKVCSNARNGELSSYCLILADGVSIIRLRTTYHYPFSEGPKVVIDFFKDKERTYQYYGGGRFRVRTKKRMDRIHKVIKDKRLMCRSVAIDDFGV